MVRALPIGVQDFKKIRDSDYLYVDKTDMISQIMSEGADVYLYTRPRRFGKSLNLSMLDAFFNVKYPKDNKWFDGLKVSDCKECQEHKNAYPVIYFDFKDLDAKDSNMFVERLSNKIRTLYIQYRYLNESDDMDEIYKIDFNSIVSGTPSISKLIGAASTHKSMRSRIGLPSPSICFFSIRHETGSYPASSARSITLGLSAINIPFSGNS